MTEEFFKNNRRALGQQLKGGLVVLAAHDEMQSAADMAYRFTQEPNFWYLTGIEEPRWRLVYDAIRDHTWLVAPDVSEIERIFNGSMEPDEAKRIAGADEVISSDDFAPLLRQLTRSHPLAHIVAPFEKKFLSAIVQNPASQALKSQCERIFAQTHDCRSDLARLRATKQPAEVTMIQRAVRLTCDSFSSAKESLENCRQECEVQAQFDYEFTKHGATHAYDPIVASGKNACRLHYIDNSAALSKRAPLLLDIGARVGGYAADISRTYAVGQVTKRQRDVHEALAIAHAQIVNVLSPGLMFTEYGKEVERIMATALSSLGLKAADEKELVYKYMPHSPSHGLGLDTHDSLGGHKMCMPGMVLTVEPGIYLPDEGFGMRIEDDILITEKGTRNLSGSLSTDL
jgi:Xaa-Pro aminopeptidase